MVGEADAYGGGIVDVWFQHLIALYRPLSLSMSLTLSINAAHLNQHSAPVKRRKTEEGSGGSSCFKGEGDAGEASSSCFATPHRQLRVGVRECGTEGRRATTDEQASRQLSESNFC